MRVLLTTDTVGGVWTYTREMVQGLLDAGDAVALVSFGRMPSAEQSAWCDEVRCRSGERFRYEASDTPLEWMQENERAYDEGAELLVRVAREFGAELVHSNQFCYGRLPVDLPKVVAAHSDVLSWGRACRPEGLESSAWLKRYVGLVQDGLDGADAVVAPTRWMLDAVGEGFRLPRRRCVIANGRTLGDVEARGLRELRAVCAGRIWDEAKGLGVLAGVGASMPLVVAGEAEFEGGDVSGLLGRGVSFAGVLGEQPMLELMRGSAVYLATSLYEPFGLAALEAGMCGCAVVARDIESLREVWGDAANYFSGADELGAVLQGLAADAEALRTAQERAQARAMRYSGQRMVEEYRGLYRELMDLQTAERGVVEVKELVAYAL